MKRNYETQQTNEATASRQGAPSASDNHEAGQQCQTKARERFTYRECLQGKVPVPTTPNGKTVFQVLMVGGMVTFMVTVNGIRHTGLEFLAQSHWLYPLMFCIAFLVRITIGDALIGFLAPRTALKWFTGTKRNVAMTVLNVCCMAPIMGIAATLLLHGTHDFWIQYLTTLPITMPIAALVNYFIVGPAVKLAFNNRISPAGGIGFLEAMSDNTASLTRLLGF